jgi:hypothetical protein
MVQQISYYIYNIILNFNLVMLLNNILPRLGREPAVPIRCSVSRTLSQGHKVTRSLSHGHVSLLIPAAH